MGEAVDEEAIFRQLNPGIQDLPKAIDVNQLMKQRPNIQQALSIGGNMTMNDKPKKTKKKKESPDDQYDPGSNGDLALQAIRIEITQNPQLDPNINLEGYTKRFKTLKKITKKYLEMYLDDIKNDVSKINLKLNQSNADTTMVKPITVIDPDKEDVPIRGEIQKPSKDTIIDTADDDCDPDCEDPNGPTIEQPMGDEVPTPKVIKKYAVKSIKELDKGSAHVTEWGTKKFGKTDLLDGYGNDYAEAVDNDPDMDEAYSDVIDQYKDNPVIQTLNSPINYVAAKHYNVAAQTIKKNIQKKSNGGQA